ncbi:MAG: YaiO family outer membrane beta-barrel protein [Acidobacteriota bacterium]|nr:YaiO family outer membrane beta-barrel protein [Acidobacteriota bacterium]
MKKFSRFCTYLLPIFLFAAISQAQTTIITGNDKIQNDKKETGNSTVKGAKKNSLENVEVETGFSTEHLSNNFAPWREFYLSASKKFKSRQAIYGVYRRTNRVRQNDDELTAGFYQPVGRRTTFFAEASASPTHRVLPKFSTLVQIEHSLKKGWGAQVGWRHTEFNTARTNTGIFTVERYFSKYRAAYTLYATNLAGVGNSAAHRVQLTRYYNEKSSLNFSFAAGREVENLGARVIRTDVQSVGIGGRHWINKHWALNYSYNFTRQGSIYTRQGFNVGIRYRF